MEIKEKIDLISKKVDIVKSKILGFMAIAGGSWLYAIKTDSKTFLDIGIWIAFILAGYGVIVNFSKLGNLYKELEEIEK